MDNDYIKQAASYYSYRQLWTIATFGKREQCGSTGKVLHTGCIGCGKSLSLITGLGMLCSDLRSRGYTNLTILIAGKTESTIMNNVGTPLKETFGEDFYYSSKLMDGYKRDAVLFDQNLVFVKLNDKNAMDAITGISNVFGCYHDEARYITEEQYRMLQNRIRGEFSLKLKDLPEEYVRSWYIASTNPAGPKHHLKKKIDAGLIREIHWYASEVRYPAFKEYFMQRMREYRFNRQAWDRDIRGEWTQQDGLVYKSFSEHRNVLPEGTEYDLSAFKRVFIGVDYGGSNTHYSAVCLCAKAYSGQYIVLSEWGGKQLPTTTICNYIAKLVRTVSDARGGNLPDVYVDPSCTAIKNDLRTYNINTINAFNEHIGGIGCIDRHFALGTLLIMASCNMLLDEIGMYRYKENSANDDVVRVDKDATDSYHDDYVDSMRYAVYSDEQTHND